MAYKVKWPNFGQHLISDRIGKIAVTHMNSNQTWHPKILSEIRPLCLISATTEFQQIMFIALSGECFSTCTIKMN